MTACGNFFLLNIKLRINLKIKFVSSKLSFCTLAAYVYLIKPISNLSIYTVRQ